MKWIKEQEYSIVSECGRWRISKAYCGLRVVYTTWRTGDNSKVLVHGTLAECYAAAEADEKKLGPFIPKNTRWKKQERL